MSIQWANTAFNRTILANRNWTKPNEQSSQEMKTGGSSSSCNTIPDLSHQNITSFMEQWRSGANNDCKPWLLNWPIDGDIMGISLFILNWVMWFVNHPASSAGPNTNIHHCGEIGHCPTVLRAKCQLNFFRHIGQTPWDLEETRINATSSAAQKMR